MSVPSITLLTFEYPGTYKTRHIIRWLQAHLHRVGIFTQVAPYNAAAQIVSLLENEDDKTRVDGACGSASLLVFGADQVITQFDWEAKRVYWVQLDTCLEKLRLQPDQFNDLMLLSGTSILPPIPEIDVDTPISKIVAARNLLSRANMSGYTACQQAHAEEYLLAYQKAIFAIKHAVSMDPKGTVQTKDAKNIPLDGHEFLGQKLPEEIYLYISRGLVGPQVLNGRTKSQILETSPLDGGSSQAYRDLVRQKLNPIRVQTLALLSQPLHRWYSRTDVTLTCWFDNEKKPLGVPDATNSEPSASADTWHVQEADIVGGEGDDFSTSPIQFAINMLSNETSAKKTVTPKSGTTALKTKKEILSNTVWRFLHDRGYINPDHTLSAWGKAVKAGLDQARKSGYPHEGKLANEAEEAILMAFELLRLDALNAKQMFSSPPYSGAPARGSDVDKANTLLISRIACLATLNHKSIGYTGPLSRHLLAYHQMAAAVRNSLRDLLEVHANNMELSGAVDRKLQPQDMTDVSASYPFTREPDLGLALAVKCFLDEQSQEPPSGENVMKWFEHATDVFKDLDKAWKLFSAVSFRLFYNPIFYILTASLGQRRHPRRR